VLEVAEVVAMEGFTRDRLLTLAAMASSEADRDPIDGAIRKAAPGLPSLASGDRLARFVPFDPVTRIFEAHVVASDGSEVQVVKGAFETVSGLAQVPEGCALRVNELAEHGHRVIAVAVGTSDGIRLAGLIALSDPARDDSKPLVDALRQMGVRTLMVTGDSAATGSAIARHVGIGEGDVFARVIP
jgi:H+-transporting ATPase